MWDRYEWANGTRWYYYPVRISLHRVGPGAVPATAFFSVALDPQVIRDVAVAKAQLNNKAHDAGVRVASRKQTSSVLETAWCLGTMLHTGDRLELYLDVMLQGLAADLPAIKHPSVTLTSVGTDVNQGRTGRDSMSRTDSVWS